MSKTLSELAAEYETVRKSLAQSASGDGIMYAQSLERQMATLWLAENDSLIGLECRFVIDGQATEQVLDVIKSNLPVIGNTIHASRPPFGIVAHRNNFVYRIAGHFIRLFWGEES